MSSPKSNSHTHKIATVLLGLVVLMCGFFMRASTPQDMSVAIMATALPQQSLGNPTFPPPVTAAPTEKRAVSSAITSEPVQVIFGTPEPDPTQAPTPSPTPTPTLRLPTSSPSSPSTASVVAVVSAASKDVAQTPTPTEATPTASPSPSPRPGPTPTYEHVTDDIRIEITRHDIKNVVYFAVELWLTDIHQLRSAFSSDQFNSATEPVADIALRNNALLAVNGDFATFNNGGIIIRNGDVYRTNRSTRQLMLIDQNGDFIAYANPPQNAEEAAAQFHQDGVWHTLVFGPILVENGQATTLPSDFFINTTRALEPRTAIGQIGPLHYIILVVDGRQDGYSQGVSMPRLQELFIEHGAHTAFNLDGGGSTTLYYDGQILNQPANGGQRHVPDILYIEK